MANTITNIDAAISWFGINKKGQPRLSKPEGWYLYKLTDESGDTFRQVTEEKAIQIAEEERAAQERAQHVPTEHESLAKERYDARTGSQIRPDVSNFHKIESSDANNRVGLNPDAYNLGDAAYLLGTFKPKLSFDTFGQWLATPGDSSFDTLYNRIIQAGIRDLPNRQAIEASTISQGEQTIQVANEHLNTILSNNPNMNDPKTQSVITDLRVYISYITKLVAAAKKQQQLDWTAAQQYYDNPNAATAAGAGTVATSIDNKRYDTNIRTPQVWYAEVSRLDDLKDNRQVDALISWLGNKLQQDYSTYSSWLTAIKPLLQADVEKVYSGARK